MRKLEGIQKLANSPAGAPGGENTRRTNGRPTDAMPPKADSAFCAKPRRRNATETGNLPETLCTEDEFAQACPVCWT